MALPPTLLYFVIYNPALSLIRKHSNERLVEEDDEDAQEQAQVLFYTANDHAVSKDRVLRQVGLAKALANFSNMFDNQSFCESVHSQTRRMIMLQPEPDYWIHALSRTERPAPKDTKGKNRQRETLFDYSEASLQDDALRFQLQLAYDSFKLKHGSFSSILSSLGKEALDLQLERFFTVWAWSWDLSKHPPFNDCLGVRIHPLSNQLLPTIELSLEDRLPPHLTPLVLTKDHVITSKDKYHPLHLVRHLFSFVQARSSEQINANTIEGNIEIQTATEEVGPEPSSVAKERKDGFKKAQAGLGHKSAPKGGTFGKRFLGSNPLSVNVNSTMSAMDIRKWSWPGYLTFKGSKDETASSEVDKRNVALDPTDDHTEEADKTSVPESSTSDSASSASVHSRERSASVVAVDSKALQDALSCMQAESSIAQPDTGLIAPAVVSLLASDVEVRPVSQMPGPSEIPQTPHSYSEGRSTPSLNDDARPNANDQESAPIRLSNDRQSPHEDLGGIYDDPKVGDVPEMKSPMFSATTVYLQGERSGESKQHRILYLSHESLLLALIPDTCSIERLDDETSQAEHLALCARDLLERLRSIIEEEEDKIATALQPSTVQSVLQKSQYTVLATRDTTFTSPSFTSSSPHLYKSHGDLTRDTGLLEIYSRRQSPADWHLAKRMDRQEKMVFMEIARKEASLPDVDGEMAGVGRRFLDKQFL